MLGGLLSERYLGRPEPGRAELNTASLQKYKQMIDAWGGWALFQELLAVAQARRRQARRRASPTSPRATSSTGPPSAGVIVGARLGLAEHIAENARVFDLAARRGRPASIDAVLARSRDLMRVIGDCGDEYRR